MYFADQRPYKIRPANLVLFIAFLFVICLFVLSGCQSARDSRLTGNNNIGNRYINFSQHYLLLSQFNAQQLMDEIHHLKSSQVNNTKSIASNLTIEWQLKSVLIYAIPKSPVHNPFTAKSKLNQLSLESLDAAILTPDDFAFFNMLKEQLNQQILLLNKLTLAKRSQDKIRQKHLKQQIEFQHLQQQMIQLKRLEANINEHGR